MEKTTTEGHSMTEPLTAQYSAKNFLNAYNEQVAHDREVDKYRRLIYGMRALAEPGYATSTQGSRARSNFGATSSSSTGMLSRFKLLRDEEQAEIKRELGRRQLEAMPNWESDDDFMKWMKGQGPLVDPDSARKMWGEYKKEQDRVKRFRWDEIEFNRRKIDDEDKDRIAEETFNYVSGVAADYARQGHEGQRQILLELRTKIADDGKIPQRLKGLLMESVEKRLEEQFGVVGKYDDATEERAVQRAVLAQESADREVAKYQAGVEEAADKRSNAEIERAITQGALGRIREGEDINTVIAETIPQLVGAGVDPTNFNQTIAEAYGTRAQREVKAPTTKAVMNLETGREEWATDAEIEANSNLVPTNAFNLGMQAAAWSLMQDRASGMTPEILKYYMTHGFDNFRKQDQEVLINWFSKYAETNDAFMTYMRSLGGKGTDDSLVVEDITDEEGNKVELPDDEVVVEEVPEVVVEAAPEVVIDEPPPSQLPTRLPETKKEKENLGETIWKWLIGQ